MEIDINKIKFYNYVICYSFSFSFIFDKILKHCFNFNMFINIIIITILGVLLLNIFLGLYDLKIIKRIIYTITNKIKFFFRNLPYTLVGFPLQNRFKKILRKNPFSWSVGYTMLEINFEMFCEFIENGERDRYDWKSTDDDRFAYEEQNKLYFWWKTLRPKHYKIYETILGKSYGDCNILKNEFLPIENSNYKTWNITFKRDDEKFLHLSSNIETWIYKIEDKNLVRLMNIRNSLNT